jgi:hypothetical protein
MTHFETAMRKIKKQCEKTSRCFFVAMKGGDPMCSGGGGGGGYVAPPKVDPAPTMVQSSDVGSSDSAAKSQKRRHGRASTMLSSDRDTILGTLTGSGGRTTLG